MLSKQVGVGAVERSHKVMKHVTFDKSRATMDPMKADRDLYTNLNTRALRKMEGNNVPDWVQFYSEEIDENIVEAMRQEEARQQMRLDAEQTEAAAEEHTVVEAS